jgi:hypothetical protein
MSGPGTIVARVVTGAAVDASGNRSAASTSTDNRVRYGLPRLEDLAGRRPVAAQLPAGNHDSAIKSLDAASNRAAAATGGAWLDALAQTRAKKNSRPASSEVQNALALALAGYA